MKILIKAEIDEDHFVKVFNDLYDRLKGYKVTVIPFPKKKIVLEHIVRGSVMNAKAIYEAGGWNDCVDYLEGEI